MKRFRKILIYLFCLLLTGLIVCGQTPEGIQEKTVMGFKSGLMNSISNDLMPDDAALVFENFDINGVGDIVRRQGLKRHYVGPKAGQPIWATIPFYQGLDKYFLAVKTQSLHFGDTAASAGVALLTLANDVYATCTTTVAEGFYNPRRDYDYPYNINYTTINNNLAIAATNSELMIYDGTYAFPARPLTAGQPTAYPISGDTGLTGVVTYKYCYFDDAATDDTSNFSAPSWPVSVITGKVLVQGFLAPDEAAVDSFLLYRSMNGGNYELIDNFADTTTAYLDTMLATLATDTTKYKWGPDAHCLSKSPLYPTGSDDCGSPPLSPPGGMTLSSIDTCLTDGYGIGCLWIGAGDTSCQSVAYSIVFIDSAGRQSYMTPAYCVPACDSNRYQFKVSLANIPIPTDSNITKKLLLRMNGRALYAGTCYDLDVEGHFYVIETLLVATTTYTDSTRIDSLYLLDYPVWCGDDYSTPPLDYSKALEPYGEEPEHGSCYDDSAIVFQPTDIAIHGFRGYAIGNTDHPNRLYYSDFGKITTWAYDNFIDVVSRTGDWYVRVLSLGERLLMFRQNSVSQLTGNSFYQYNINELIGNVGLSAPRSLAVGLNQVFFLHSSGIYQFSRFENIPPAPISTFIKNSIDSVGSKIQRAWGGMVGDEYWQSLAVDSTDNNKTYIYAQIPTPHFKCYDFGIMDGCLYDYDTTLNDYRTDRWIFALDNDSLWRWNYSPTSDTIDDTTIDAGSCVGGDGCPNLIVATYQSKYFFEGDDREKIHYLDLIGSGQCDTMMITFYENYGDSILGRTQRAVDSVTVALNWYEGQKQRIIVDHILSNFSFKLKDYGVGQYKLKGFVIGYTPWDRGRIRP